tara:strand:+ start:187 stop:411 length:225 start_codon:yes stop_codon:yes gene_type:complete
MKNLFYKKAYKNINKIIEAMDESVVEQPETKGLLNRTSRGLSKTDETEMNEPIFKVARYVKQIRKMREGIKNAK